MWPLHITTGMQIYEFANFPRKCNLQICFSVHNAEMQICEFADIANLKFYFSVLNAKKQIGKFADIAKFVNLLFSSQCCPGKWGFMLAGWVGLHVAMVGGAACCHGGWGLCYRGWWGFMLPWWVGLHVTRVGGASGAGA